MTTIKPATPLQWTVERGDGCFTIRHAEDGRICSLHYAHGIKAQFDCQKQDAVYIVHACNAYPRLEAERAKLITALRECMNTLTARGMPTQHEMLDAARKAHKLLSRLSEDA